MEKENFVPRWDLSPLYPSLNSEELEKDISLAGTQAQRFHTRYVGKIAQAHPKQFLKMISEYESVCAKMSKIGAFAEMTLSVDMNSADVTQGYEKVFEKFNQIETKTTFFEQEISDLPDNRIAELKKDPGVAKYGFWLDRLQADKKYALSAEKENEIEQYQNDSFDAVKQYRQIVNGIAFQIDGKPVTDNDLYALGYSANKNDRRKANEAYTAGYETKIGELTDITNRIAKNKAREDSMRGFKEPVESRNVSNRVENEVVDALVGSVKGAYGDVSHRYYALKSKWMGDERIGYWDRNAPVAGIEPRKYSFKEAEKIVVDAYTAFDPEIGAIAKAFFDEKRIDAEPRPGKQGGEYAQPMTEGKPFIKMNFHGTANDVFCLAHELGHGIHYTLAQKQGELGFQAPITVNETASIFGEMLAFNHMMEQEKDPKQRFALLSDKAGRTMLTTFRQIAMHEYETQVHKQARTKGDLETKDLNNIWTTCQREALGPSVINDKRSETAWAGVPHLLQTPFYVYAYAFGECLTASLYQTYESGKVPDFQKKYKEMLAKGGTTGYKELLAPFGLDASKPDFWQQGLKTMKNNIDKLETLTDTLGMDKTKTNRNAAVQAKRSGGR